MTALLTAAAVIVAAQVTFATCLVAGAVVGDWRARRRMEREAVAEAEQILAEVA